MYEWFAPLIAGALLSVLILLAEHFLLWHVTLKLTTRYALGTAALGAGLTLAAMLAGEWFALSFWGFAAIGGGVVEGLHRWRASRGETAPDIEDAFAAGQVAARAGGKDKDGAPRASGAGRN